MIAQDAVSCVALGTGKALDNLDALDGKEENNKTKHSGKHYVFILLVTKNLQNLK